jgi:hypothetical protein
MGVMSSCSRCRSRFWLPAGALLTDTATNSYPCNERGTKARSQRLKLVTPGI